MQKTMLFGFVIILCFCVAAAIVFGQTGGDFTISQSVVAGGGGNSAAGSFVIDSTVGQTFGGGDAASSGGTFTIGSGFWAGAIPVASPTPGISGTVTYANAIGAPNPRFVSNVTISGAGSPNVITTTDGPGATAGQYLLTGFGAGSYTVTPTKTGGVSGAISSFDAAKVAQHSSGVATLTGNQLVAADVSGNGTITSFDAGQIGRFVTSSPPFGSAGVWRFSPVNRPYASVTTNVTGEDYDALLMGEVSGNWQNTGSRSVVSHRLSVIGEESSVGGGQWAVGSKDQDIAAELPQLTVAADKQIDIPVSVQGVADKGIIAYEFDLRYDPSVIQPRVRSVDLASTASRGLTAVVNAEEPGLLRVAVYGIEAIRKDGVLLNLRFATVGVPGWVSALAFERIMFNEGETRVTAVAGRIEVSTRNE